jgi:tol-pal system protein YbgF
LKFKIEPMLNLVKPRLILIAGLAAIGLCACVQPQQVQVLERDQRRLQAENAALQKELGSVRTSLADGGANMEQLQREFNTLKGQIEETRHLVGQEIDQSRGQGDKRVKDLEARLAKLTEGFESQERQLKSREDELKELREWMQQLSTLASAVAIPITPTELGSGESEAVNRDYEVAWRGLEKRDYRFAIARFKDFLNKYPKSKLAGSAHYRIGESHFALREFEQAIIEFDAVRTRYPQEGKAAAALLRQALSFAELGENSNARVLLQELTEKFAQTPEAVQAKLRLKSLPS